MNEIYVQMSEQLDRELILLPKKNQDDIFFTSEKAVGLCTIVLLEMKELVSENEFPDKASEIHFFKQVKPKVYGKLIFYLKLLKIETYRPSFSREHQINYLLTVLKDLEKIYEQYAEFYRYYRLNHSCLDEKYFTRNSRFSTLDAEHIHLLIDRKFSTARDYTLALFIAHQQLIEHLGAEIGKLRANGDKESHFKTTNPNSCNYCWTESKVALVELIYALHSARSINKGKIGIKEIAHLFESIFNIELGDIYRIFLEVRSRKIEQTKYMDYLKDSLLRRMDEADGK